MSFPFFYIDQFHAFQNDIELDENNSRHAVQVLRMKKGESLHLTDGKGNFLLCEIADDHKKHCLVNVKAASHRPRDTGYVSIAISLLKNTGRFEWFLEKATELGVAEIIPLICERTEKQKFRSERMKEICVSALLQSQQCWLPDLHEPQKYENMKMWIPEAIGRENGMNFIAHCMDSEKQSLTHFHTSTSSHSLICIGPEGDFTTSEIQLALDNQFIPVSIGKNRLRSETAAIAAAVLLKLS